jgi:hypothetical protein
MNSTQRVNEKCLCNSGKNYKKCCMNKTPQDTRLLHIKEQMEYYSKKSNELYKACYDEGCNGIIDPVTWIFNQDKMRHAWETYKMNTEKSPENLRNVMLNNSFSKYMSFMYDTYPPGFGNKLKKCYDKKINFDGAEWFYNLKNN